MNGKLHPEAAELQKKLAIDELAAGKLEQEKSNLTPTEAGQDMQVENFIPPKAKKFR